MRFLRQSQSLLARSVWWRTSALGAFWVVIVAIVLAPFLFFGRMFIDSDSTIYYYPVFDFYHRAIVSGTSFLWNPQIFLGFPTYLSQSAGFFDPVNWILFHLPMFTAYHLRLALDFLMVLVFSYLAGREFNRTRLASLMIGMGYIIAFNWRYLSNVLVANVIFLMPFLFYAVLRLYRAESEKVRWGWIALMGAAVGWCFVAGNAQFTVFSIFLLSLFYIFFFWFLSGLPKTISGILRWIGYGIAIVAIGFVVGLPQILPALKFTPNTVRANGVAYDISVFKAIDPGDTILFAFPDYTYFPYVSSGRKPLYVGALLFLLALIGMRECWRRRSRDFAAKHEANMMRIIFLLLAFCFIASLAHSPLFWLMQHMPVFKLFRFPYRWMYNGSWLLALFGAYGFDILYLHAAELRQSWMVRITAVILGGLSLGIILLNILGESIWHFVAGIMYNIFALVLHGHGAFTKDPAHYQAAFVQGIDAWREFTSLTDYSFAIPFLILIFSLILVGFVIFGRVRQSRFRSIAFVISLVTFFAVFMVQWPYSVPQSLAGAHEEFINTVVSPKDLAQYRTYPFLLGNSLSAYIQPTYQTTLDQTIAGTEVEFAGGLPNTNMYDPNVATVDGYDPFVPSDFEQVLGSIGSSYGGSDSTRTFSGDENTHRLLSHLGVLGMLSGRFIISGVPLTNPSLTLLATSSVSHYHGVLYTYDNKLALPRWYFAKKVVDVPHTSLSQLLQMVDQNSFDKQTYLDCVSCEMGGAVSPKDSIAATSSSPASLQFVTQTKNPRWLVVTESNLSGWQASIDDQPAGIVRANGMLMAILVPAGDHQITFEYEGIVGEANFFKALHIFK